MDKDIKAYLNDIGKYLVCRKKQKKIILEDIEVSVRDYVENANIDNISEVISRFGSPEDIAKSYLSELGNPSEVRKSLDKKRVVIAGVVIALVIWLIVGIIALVDGHTYDTLYVESQINEHIDLCINVLLLRS